jgi:hypothetical protein
LRAAANPRSESRIRRGRRATARRRREKNEGLEGGGERRLLRCLPETWTPHVGFLDFLGRSWALQEFGPFFSRTLSLSSVLEL